MKRNKIGRRLSAIRNITITTALAMAMTCAVPVAGAASYAAQEADTRDADVNPPTTASDLLIAYDNEGNEIPASQVSKKEYDGYIYVLKDGVTRKHIAKMNQKIDQIGDEDIVEEIMDDQIYTADSLQSVEEVADLNDIDYIEPNYTREIFEDKSVLVQSNYDPYHDDNSWAYGLMNVPAVWDKNITGSGVNGNPTPVVAIVDTGLTGFNDGYSADQPQHEDINYNNVAWGAKYYQSCNDRQGHGSHIAGIIAAKMNNRAGICGVMPNAKLGIAKAMNDKGRGSTDAFIKMINYIIENYPDTAVINMSLGGPEYSKAENKVCQAAAAKGIILVAAAGNDGKSAYQYPASYKNVVSVAALGPDGTRASYSQHNDKVDVAAPGSDILSIEAGSADEYVYMSGTSMAAPMVSALAAMAKSLDQNITPAQFMDIIKTTSTDLGKTGYDSYYGYGVADFGKAYTAITGASTKESIASVEMSTDSFEYDGTAHRPDLLVYGSNGQLLTEGTDYSVMCADTTDIGIGTVTVYGKNNYVGRIAQYIMVKPGRSQLIKLSRGKKSFKASWEAADYTGYQIRYSTKSSMGSAKKVTISNNYTTVKTVKKLKSRKKYYVQVRTYQEVNGYKFYSDWSKKKYVKTK